MKFGLNMFSLREQTKTKEETIEVVKRLQAMGYDYFQFSGTTVDTDTRVMIAKELGAPIVLTHTKFDAMMADPEGVVADHALYGCENIGLGMREFRGKTEEEIYAAIAEIKEASEKIKAAGGHFYYHHHNFEFIKLSNGKTIFEEIIEKCPEVNFTLDTFWLQAGGVSIVEYIEKLKGRICCVHLKDFLPGFKQNEEGKWKMAEPKFAPVGDGNINWQDVMTAFKKAGVQYYLVEQDDATKYDDPMAQVERSIKYLKENF